MVKIKIIETTEKFDKDGNLVERITREESSEDNTEYNPTYSRPSFSPLWGSSGPICNAFFETPAKKAVR